MKTLSALSFLLAFVALLNAFPRTELEVEFEHIDQTLSQYPECNQSPCEKATELECKCLDLSHMGNCSSDVWFIEHGLKKLNFNCKLSDKTTFRTCRLLKILTKYILNSGQEENGTTLCNRSISQKEFLLHIKREIQKYNSRS